MTLAQAIAEINGRTLFTCKKYDIDPENVKYTITFNQDKSRA